MDRSRRDQGLAQIAAAFGVDVVYVFGSRAREVAGVDGETSVGGTDSSDVDIGVQPARGCRLTARDRVRITHALEEFLGVPRVDLVVVPEANPFLAADIVRGELLYARDLDEEAALQLYHLRRAGDLAPFFRERWNEMVGSGS